MSKNIKVSVPSYSGKLTAELRTDGPEGPRVDVWQNVHWVGQWKWTGECPGENISKSTVRFDPLSDDAKTLFKKLAEYSR